jgi:hypothetical protein
MNNAWAQNQRFMPKCGLEMVNCGLRGVSCKCLFCGLNVEIADQALAFPGFEVDYVKFAGTVERTHIRVAIDQDCTNQNDIAAIVFGAGPQLVNPAIDGFVNDLGGFLDGDGRTEDAVFFLE